MPDPLLLVLAVVPVGNYSGYEGTKYYSQTFAILDNGGNPITKSDVEFKTYIESPVIISGQESVVVHQNLYCDFGPWKEPSSKPPEWAQIILDIASMIEYGSGSGGGKQYGRTWHFASGHKGFVDPNA